MVYLNRLGLRKELDALFPTNIRNATKFTNAQIMLAIILASLAGVSRLIKIATFTCDALVMALFGLGNGLNKDVISLRFKVLGQRGAIYLPEFVLARIRR